METRANKPPFLFTGEIGGVNVSSTTTKLRGLEITTMPQFTDEACKHLQGADTQAQKKKLKDGLNGQKMVHALTRE